MKTSPSAGPNRDERCARCCRSLVDRSVFTLGRQRRCLRCALQYRPMLRRSALTSLVVGTILVAINQGAVLFAGQVPPSLTWQIPLTYLVPFCVASWGALSNSRDWPTKAERDQAG